MLDAEAWRVLADEYINKHLNYSDAVDEITYPFEESERLKCQATSSVCICFNQVSNAAIHVQCDEFYSARIVSRWRILYLQEMSVF